VHLLHHLGMSERLSSASRSGVPASIQVPA
jgi:hypothetical protein